MISPFAARSTCHSLTSQFYDIAWTPLNLAYPVEVLSFSLRAKGMSLWSLFGSVALCLNTWVNPIALKAIGFWYYIVYIGVLVYLLVIAYFFFPETKGWVPLIHSISYTGPNADPRFLVDSHLKRSRSGSTATRWASVFKGLSTNSRPR
jgi:hypothetical protein